MTTTGWIVLGVITIVLIGSGFILRAWIGLRREMAAREAVAAARADLALLAASSNAQVHEVEAAVALLASAEAALAALATKRTTTPETGESLAEKFRRLKLVLVGATVLSLGHAAPCRAQGETTTSTTPFSNAARFEVHGVDGVWFPIQEAAVLYEAWNDVMPKQRALAALRTRQVATATKSLAVCERALGSITAMCEASTTGDLFSLPEVNLAIGCAACGAVSAVTCAVAGRRP